MSKVLVIGGGAAGLMSAYAASQKGHTVELFEKNTQFGKKLLMTGHGRCNITNNGSKDDFFKHIVHNEKFLYSAFSQFSNQDFCEFLHKNGLMTCLEDHGRLFPSSQCATDVVLFFLDLLKKNQVSLHTQEECKELWIENQEIRGIVTNKKRYTADVVIVATGGLSFSQTGSTGDGLRWAKEYDLKVNPTYPGLVSMKSDFKDWAGLSFKDIKIKITRENKNISQGQGDLIFTHQGISGPIILNASSYVINKNVDTLHCDFLPKFDEAYLDQNLVKLFQKNPNKSIYHILEQLFPSRFVQVLLDRLSISKQGKANQCNRTKRQAIVNLLKDFPIKITGFGNYNEAMITIGGISPKEINPKNMESKQIKGLKFAGELIDLDGQTGGYNLQIAWSTGYCAGSTI